MHRALLAAPGFDRFDQRQMRLSPEKRAHRVHVACRRVCMCVYVCVCVCARCVRGKGGSERAGESHPLLPDLAFIQHALDGLGNLCVCVRTRERHEHCVLRLCLYMRRHTILLALCFCSFWSSQKFEACACEERSSTGSHTSPLSLVRDRFDAMERPSAFCSSRSRRGGTA